MNTTRPPGLVLYGIPNCDTVKKARHWLEAAGHPCRFHDFRKDGLPEALLRGWVAEVGWEVLLNRAGTTFRKLPDEDRKDLDEERAVALMLAQPSLIKRPVLSGAGPLRVGFKPELYAAAFA
jgi:Spx/MgsR family transcriptional regulator